MSKKLLPPQRKGDEKKIRQRAIMAMYRIIERDPGVRSRKAFAERIFTSPQSVHKWEKHDGFPTIQNLADICEQFEIDANWLLLGNGKMQGDIELAIRIEMLEGRVTNIEKFTGMDKEKTVKKTSKEK